MPARGVRPRVSGGPDQARPGIDSDHGGGGAQRPAAGVKRVPHGSEGIERGGPDLRIDPQSAQCGGFLAERADEMVGHEPRGDTDAAGASPKSRWLSRSCSVIWSWLSPPATLTASTGLRPSSTSVGVSVIRGRLPGSMQLGWPGQRLKLWSRRAQPDARVAGHDARPAARRGRHDVALPGRPRGRSSCLAAAAGRPSAASAAGRAAPSPRGSPGAAIRATHAGRVDQARRAAAYSGRAGPPSGTSANERVGVVGVAVGQGELHRLDRQVDGVGPVVAQRLQVEPFEELQGLQQVRPLGPRAALVDRVAAVSTATGSSMRVTCVARSA